MKKIVKVLVVILLLNLSAGALYGSWIFISDPSGGKFFLSVDLLSSTPFKSYLIPGVILLIVNGLFPLFILIFLLLRKSYFKWLLLLQGCVLIGWLSIQLLISKDFFMPVMHYSCYATGLLLIVFSFLLLKMDHASLRMTG